MSLDVPKEKLASVGAGLVFPDSTAKHFWTNLKIHYSVAVASKKSIKKKSENSASTKSDSNKATKKEKLEKATSTSGDKEPKVVVSASTQSLSTAASSGATAKPEASITATTPGEDVRETPC